MIRDAISRLIEGETVSAGEAEVIALEIMDGEATPAQIGALLALLRVRGETVEHLAGFVRALRSRMEPFPRPEGLGVIIDTCGTGGDGAGSFNISTAAAFIAAGAGAFVAKHGNRSVSSRCGSADVVEALGVDLSPTPEVAAQCLEEAGFCFLFAPRYHPAMSRAAGPRRELGIRTLFNLCGPLCNPARPARQLVGVGQANLISLAAQALRALGVERALVVHSDGGMDEIAPFGQTSALEMDERAENTYHHHLLEPAKLGLPDSSQEDLAGGDAADNAALLENEVLAGKSSPRANAAILNAAAALWVSGLAEDISEGLEMSRSALAAGKPLEVLRRLRAVAPRR
jgi:anthranilate phosphoribosyltransferase